MNGRHSPKGNRQNNSWNYIIVAALLLVVILAVVFIIAKPGGEQGEQPQGGTEQSEQTEPVEKLTDTIAMPGYSWLNLKADTTEQELTLPNPPQNFCQMRMSILLEDGTVLWTSELVQPGESTKPIVLAQPLAKGEYKNALLKYECFTNDEAMTPLNGGQVTLSLRVH